MTENTAPKEQLRAQTTWFHVFKSMVESGDVAKMGSGPVAIYLVIKAYTNWRDGKAFPSTKTICEKAVMGRASVMIHIKTLEDFGYLRRESGRAGGRVNLYTLREKVELKNSSTGEPEAVASWDYLPSTVKTAVQEIRNVALKGDFQGVQLINIERLYINVKNLAQGHDVTQVNAEIDAIQDPELREQFKRFYAQAVTREQQMLLEAGESPATG